MVTVLVLVAGAFFVFTRQHSATLPQSLGRYGRIDTDDTRAVTDQARQMMESQQGVFHARAAAYGPSESSVVYLLVVAEHNFPAGAAKDVLKGFKEGLEEKRELIDSDPVVEETIGGTTFDCVSFSAGQQAGAMCIWVRGHSFGMGVGLDLERDEVLSLSSEASG